jgi:uncharacterized glyoxalase superfamily protein PhnB
MTPDPMQDLRQVDRPIQPRPEFTADLRARIERELGPIPPGAAISTTEEHTVTATRLHTITPYLAVGDARAAIAWYQDIFGATVSSAPIIMPDDRVGHVELRIGDATIMMADEFAEIDVLAPTSRGGTTVSFVINVPNVDAVYARAVAAGATAERPPADQFYGDRAGWLSDPWGHRWSISTPLAAVAGGLAEQDLGTKDVPVVDLGTRAEATPADEVTNLGYFTIGVPDVERASTFYATLFGWQLEGGSTEEGRHVVNITPPGGLHGGEDGPSITVYFRVADIQTAVVRVRALGGDASEPQLVTSGWNAACHDDQGVAFDLWQPAEGY